MDIEEKMSCPADLSEWVNANPKAMWFVYDLNLMPEQITNRGEICALRGFRYGWDARGLKEAAQHSVNPTDGGLAIRACVNASCGWVGKESSCLTWKHAGDERFCPYCNDNTESIPLSAISG